LRPPLDGSSSSRVVKDPVQVGGPCRSELAVGNEVGVEDLGLLVHENELDPGLVDAIADKLLLGKTALSTLNWTDMQAPLTPLAYLCVFIFRLSHIYVVFKNLFPGFRDFRLVDHGKSTIKP